MAPRRSEQLRVFDPTEARRVSPARAAGARTGLCDHEPARTAGSRAGNWYPIGTLAALKDTKSPANTGPNAIPPTGFELVSGLSPLAPARRWSRLSALKRRIVGADGSCMKRLRIAYADRVGAGASAEARYRTLLHSWRARNKALVPLALIPVLAWVLACALLWPAHSSSYASFGVGAAIVLYVTVRLLLIPAHIERWRDGAEAEKQTAKQLRPLLRARDWTAVHDRASRYGNRDHIVVGPPCVYLLDTKAPVGAVTVEGDVMTVRRREDPEDHYEQRTLAGRMRGAAAELADDLGHETGKRPWVTPVVVIWAPFEQRVVEDGGVLWIQGKALRGWLNSQETKLEGGRLEQLGRAIEGLPEATNTRERSLQQPPEPSRA
jgi:hypothetical protein